MLRQHETLQKVASHGPLEKHVRHRPDGNRDVIEYHTDEYFVRAVFEANKYWLVKWYDHGARPLAEVGRFDDREEALSEAKRTVKKILNGVDNPRL